MSDDDVLSRALACMPPDRLLKATAARQRYERRQARLQRLVTERERQRHALLHNSIARALAKAAAADSDDTDQYPPP